MKIYKDDHDKFMENKITEEMLDVYLGGASNYQSRENLRYECTIDKEVKKDVLDYWETVNGEVKDAQTS